MTARIYLCGRIAMEADGDLVDERSLPGRQGRVVFARLVAEHARPVAQETLAEELWTAEPPSSWRRDLSAIVSKLRAAAARLPAVGLRIEGAPGSYQAVLPADAWIDLEQASRALDLAEAALRQGEQAGTHGWALVAASIARRPFLAGVEGPWVARTRTDLRSTLVRSLDCLAEAMLWNGEPQLAIERAEESLRLEPFRETSYQRLMRAHAGEGNRAEALRVYERCRRLFEEELGVPPSPQTEAVYLDVLRA